MRPRHTYGAPPSVLGFPSASIASKGGVSFRCPAFSSRGRLSPRAQLAAVAEPLADVYGRCGCRRAGWRRCAIG